MKGNRMDLSFLQQDIIEQLIFGNHEGEQKPLEALAAEINSEVHEVRNELAILEKQGIVARYPWRYAGKTSDFFHYTQNGGMSDGLNG